MTTDNHRILRASRWKYLPYFLLSLGFTVLGILQARDDTGGGILVAGGFGLATAAFAVLLLPRRGYLSLTPDHLTVCSFYRTRRYRWSDVLSFGVGRFGLQKIVAVRLSPDKNRHAEETSSGHEDALPDTYGLPAEQLAVLLDDWRRRYAPS